MLNLKPFDIARKRLLLSEIPFLLKQREHAYLNKPYKGLRVIQNTPLSMESICKLEPLVLGGADVTVTINKAIHPSSQTEAIKLVHAIGLRFTPDHTFDGPYDFGLDCGAELAQSIIPKQGIVEITQTGSEIYKKLDLPIPVISVDDSLLKLLETFFGTGDGCVRALQQLAQTDLKKKHYVLFGYGKVGQGVLHSLAKQDVTATVVDIDPDALRKARINGYQALHITKDHAQIEKEIVSAFAIITATGVPNVISSHFGKHLFTGKILANIGVEDEFGQLFNTHEVLFGKQPINFSLEAPTKMRYLDPIFYAHNYGIEHILNHKLAPGYHPFPHEIDTAIVTEWESLFGEDISHLKQLYANKNRELAASI